jgi:tetratricopeptide (TPR) repeat protein
VGALTARYATAYCNRGNAWKDKKEYGWSFADYTEAIRIDPKVAMAYNNRAWLWATCPDEKHPDGRKAVESASRACELTGWKDASNVAALAAAHAEAGDFDTAVVWQEEALKLSSGADKAHRSKRLRLYREKKAYRAVD